MLSDLVFRLRSLFRRNTVEAELDDECFHFEKLLQDLRYGWRMLARPLALARFRSALAWRST